jgi:5-methylcytosine-specific restriction endonuclease McrA
MPRSAEYEARFRAPDWRLYRELLIVYRAENRCQRCRRKFCFDDLTLHHVTYDRLGRERLEDLVVCCWPCHELERQV